MSRNSRYLSMVLRHAPEEIGLTLDDSGWASVEELLRQLKKAGRPITRQELQELVAQNDKRRFTLSSDGSRIRAAQGHTIDVQLGLIPTKPPEFLFHGTARANLDAIFSNGIKSGARRQVHLSRNPDTAIAVGTRHGKPVLLRILAGDMYNAGFQLFEADNGVWLTDHVPPAFVAFGTTG